VSTDFIQATRAMMLRLFDQVEAEQLGAQLFPEIIRATWPMLECHWANVLWNQNGGASTSMLHIEAGVTKVEHANEDYLQGLGLHLDRNEQRVAIKPMNRTNLVFLARGVLSISTPMTDAELRSNGGSELLLRPHLRDFVPFTLGEAHTGCIAVGFNPQRGGQAMVRVNIDNDRREDIEGHLRAAGYAEGDVEGHWRSKFRENHVLWSGGTLYGCYGGVPKIVGHMPFDETKDGDDGE
jgi:hypothetical protein